MSDSVVDTLQSIQDLETFKKMASKPPSVSLAAFGFLFIVGSLAEAGAPQFIPFIALPEQMILVVFISGLLLTIAAGAAWLLQKHMQFDLLKAYIVHSTSTRVASMETAKEITRELMEAQKSADKSLEGTMAEAFKSANPTTP